MHVVPVIDPQFSIRVHRGDQKTYRASRHHQRALGELAQREAVCLDIDLVSQSIEEVRVVED